MAPAVETRGFRKYVGRLGVGLPLALASIYVTISLIAADILTRPNNRPVTTDPRMVAGDAVSWSTRTADGLTLRGWYYPTPGRRQLLVLVHGMGGSREDMAALGGDLHRRGYDVLLFDLRGHGASDPARLSMGRNERGDLRAVLKWAVGAGFSPDRIGWIGQSMGAATLLMEGAANPSFRAVVLDSPFGDLPDLLKSQLTRHSHLPSWFNPGILLAAHRAYGIRTDDLVPVRTARQWKDRPVLIVHGENDTTVPVRQARSLARALGPSCRLITVPGVAHVRAYDADPETYVAIVDHFFRRNLDAPGREAPGRPAGRGSATIRSAVLRVNK